MLYFAHDIGASQDTKIVALRLTCGGAAVDAFWYLVELMHAEESGLHLLNNPVGVSVVSHGLCVDPDTLRGWIDAMVELDLFEVDGETIYSERVLAQVEAYNKRAETARQNGKKGGRKPSKNPVGYQVGSQDGTQSGTQPLSKEKKRKDTGFSSKKPSNRSLSALASEDEGAKNDTQVAPHCSTCGSLAKFDVQRMCFICPSCGELRSKEEVAYR